MSMGVWQRLAARAVQTSEILFPVSGRAHHSLAVSPHGQLCMGALDPIPFPRVFYPGAEAREDSISATVRSPFMQLMAVPKRKVSPSRKGKRNGPKALKPVPVVAKCKVCGRIKLPHLYCCSGEKKVEEI